MHITHSETLIQWVGWHTKDFGFFFFLNEKDWQESKGKERRELSTEAESRITVGCCLLTAHTYKRAIESNSTPDSVSQGEDLENWLLVRYAFLHSYTAPCPTHTRVIQTGIALNKSCLHFENGAAPVNFHYCLEHSPDGGKMPGCGLAVQDH